MFIVCLIPAYNEARHISGVVKSVRSFVNEVVVIDDGSTDETATRAKEAGATLLKHVVNRGQGAALRTGSKYALARGADIIVHFDADDQFQAEEIPALTAPLIAGQAAAVLGSRFLAKKSALPWQKRLVVWPLARLVNRWLFKIRLSDPQSGFRAFSRETAEKIQIESDGMAHCSEILYQLFKYKIPLLEVPITVRYHDYGQGFGGGLKIIGELIIRKIIK